LLKYQNFLQHCSLFFKIPTNYFQICIQQNFKSLNEIVLSMYVSLYPSSIFAVTVHQKTR